MNFKISLFFCLALSISQIICMQDLILRPDNEPLTPNDQCFAKQIGNAYHSNENIPELIAKNIYCLLTTRDQLEYEETLLGLVCDAVTDNHFSHPKITELIHQQKKSFLTGQKKALTDEDLRAVVNAHLTNQLNKAIENPATVPALQEPLNFYKNQCQLTILEKLVNNEKDYFPKGSEDLIIQIQNKYRHEGQEQAKIQKDESKDHQVCLEERKNIAVASGFFGCAVASAIFGSIWWFKSNKQ